MTTSTAGLSLQEAFAQAQDELSLSEEGLEADTSSPEPVETLEAEQPVVETSSDVGLFDDEDEDNEGQVEQPQGDSYEVTVDGEKLLVGLDELRSGYMRQADYTRKTQQLSELEREAEKAVALKQMLEERPQETLRKLYQRINAGQSLDFSGEMSPSNVQPKQESQDIEALVEARVAELLANDPRLVAVQQEQAFAQIESIFAGIEESYSVKLTDSDKQKVLEKSQETGNTDLEAVFGAMYAKRLAAERKRDADKANLRKVSSLKGEGRVDSFNPQTPSSQPKKYDNFRSALEEELALYEQEAATSAL
jgi:hypothetical protein